MTGKPDSRNKWILMVLAALIIGVLADLLLWYTTPGSLAYTQTGETVVLTQENIDSGKAKIEDGRYIPKGGRVILSFVTGRLFGRDVVIRLWEAQEQKTPVRLSYAKAGMDFNNDRSIVLRPEKDQSEIRFTLPEGDWNRFKLAYAGPFSLQEIVVSKEPATQIRLSWRPLIHRILLIAAGIIALTLLVTLVPPVRKALSVFYRRCLDPETRFRAIDWVYFVFALLMVFHHVYAIIWQSRANQTADLFQIPFFLFAIVSVLLGRMWKDKGFWCLLALFLFMYFRAAILEAEALYDVRRAYIFGAYAFFGCYSVGRAIRPDLRKRFVQIFCMLWTVGITILCLIGMNVAWTGKPVTLPGGRVLEIEWVWRLGLLQNSVVTGILFAVSLAVALIGFFLCGKKALRFLYIPAIIIMLLTETLTSTRTAYIIAAVVFSIPICLWIYDRMKPAAGKHGYRIAPWKWGVVAASFAAFVLIFTVAQPYIVDGFNAVRLRGGVLVNTAWAEEAWGYVEYGGAQRGIEHRSLLPEGALDTSFSGRADVWKAVLQYLWERPKSMLFGESINSSMGEINAVRTAAGLNKIAHCHSSFFQMLYDNGLFGFLPFAAFFVLGLVRSYRLMTNRDLPFWQRLLPLPAIGCLIGELVDLTCGIKSGYPQMTLLYLFFGLVCAFSSATGKQWLSGTANL